MGGGSEVGGLMAWLVVEVRLSTPTGSLPAECVTMDHRYFTKTGRVLRTPEKKACRLVCIGLCEPWRPLTPETRPF
jgi:hypothetical protein